MGALLCYGLFFLAIIFHRQILLLFSILTGDKETLNDVGNLCEDKVPWQDTVWTRQERGEPEPPPRPTRFRKWDGHSPWRVGEKEGDAQ